jgi:PAS domain S-box-containing protein
MEATLGCDESARVEALRRYMILDSAPEPEFDELVRLASYACGVPMAANCYIDEGRLWIKAKFGLEATEIQREAALCTHTIEQSDLFVVPDTLADPALATNPLVAGEPHVRFYAGVPLVTPEGHVVGTLCVMDERPRELSPEQLVVLRALADQLLAQIELRRQRIERERIEEVHTRLQVAVRKSAHEWRLTFDAIESPILILDSEGRVARLNQAAQQLAGKSYSEIIEEPVELLGPASPWREAAALVARLQESRMSLSVQTRDEACGRTWDITATPFTGTDSSDERVTVVMRDVTELVRMQERLRRSETMSAMGTLVAGVAHEVRNPLFSISATLDSFEARFGEQPDFQRYLALLRGELQRLTGLMQELLEYGKPPSLDLARVSLAEVVAQAVRSCAAQARQARVRISDETARVDALLMADRKRLVQVFQNLFENAIQHSPLDATVRVFARRVTQGEEKWVECAVEDEGAGFRDEDVTKIFEPFFTRRRGGTGLGLSIVQRIVEEHWGQVAASNGEGRGALMTVRLPLVARD